MEKLKKDTRVAKRLYKKLEKKLKEGGFRAYTKEMQQRDRDRFKVKLSKAAHVKHTLGTIGFIFESGSYRIIIWATYDPVKKLFSEKGSPYLIIALGANRIFARQFHRKDGFVMRIVRDAYGWADILDNQPNDSTGKPMYLKRTSYGGCRWVSVNNRGNKSPYKFVREELRQGMIDLCDQKNEYDRIATSLGRRRLPDFKKTAVVMTPMHLEWVASNAA